MVIKEIKFFVLRFVVVEVFNINWEDIGGFDIIK